MEHLPQEMIDQMHQNLTCVGMKIDKADLRRRLIRPGEERLQLIKWALSEFDIVVKDETEIPEIVMSMGLCPSSEIVLGNCSAHESLQFWQRLFHMVHVHKNANADRAQSFYKNNCEFWQSFSSSPGLRNHMQKKKKEQQTPEKVNSNSKDKKLIEELARQRLVVLKELEEIEKENKLGNTETKVSNPCESDKVSGEEEIEEVKLLTSQLEQKLSTVWMPWMTHEVKDLHQEEFSKLIPDISEKIGKLKLMCEDSKKIVRAVENIKTVELGEPNIGHFKLPDLH